MSQITAKLAVEAKPDIIPKLGKNMDTHLVFPLLEFLSSKKIYDEKELLAAKLNLLNKTNMVDFSIELYQKLNPNDPAPEELTSKRKRVVEEMQELQQAITVILGVLTQEDVAEQIDSGLEGKLLFDYVVKNHQVKQEDVDSLYKYAKCQYECGNYQGADEYLTSHRLFCSPADKNYLSNLWGKLACGILMQKWTEALEDFSRLKEYIDSFPYFTSLELLQQRTWLIHWSLFIFFNIPHGRDLLIEMLFDKKNNKTQQLYLNAIETLSPHMLRYLATAVITHRKRREYMRELVRIIQQESYTYRDAITEFVLCLYVRFDFNGAQQKLKECSEIFDNDFFLVGVHDEFVENARLFIFETFCRIHECVSINLLADKLNMSPDEAERWIVNLIQEAQLDAKIDSKLGHVLMGNQPTSAHQQLIEKTKALSMRCRMLISNLEKKQVSEPMHFSSNNANTGNSAVVAE